MKEREDIMSETAISFPNLGITFPHVGKTITIFGFDIAYYGIIIGIAIMAGIIVAQMEARRTKQDTEMYLDFYIYAVIFSIIGARIYFVIFSWDTYKDDLLSVFYTRGGGMAIYGAVIAALLTLIVFSKLKKQNFFLMADTGCIGLIIGQIIGRWGNFFNREAFGEYTNNLFAMKLPYNAVRYSDITEKMREHMSDGCIQVHPTFLYESVWNLGVFLLLLFYRKRKRFDGELLLFYLGSYGLGRFWIEALRTDQLLLFDTGIPVSQLLAGILTVISFTFIIWKRMRIKKEGRNANMNDTE